MYIGILGFGEIFVQELERMPCLYIVSAPSSFTKDNLLGARSLWGIQKAMK